jgi:DegV family protein with EDD domain
MAGGSRVAVVTDSTADVPPELAANRAITIVPLTVTVDGQSYLDGVDIEPAAFYARLSSPSTSATTSQPSPGRFAETYQRLLADHDEVVSLHISSKMSGTCVAAVQGAELAGGGRVRVLDTGLVSMPLGLLALAAAAMAAEGDAAERIVQRLGPLLEGMRVYFMVATLEHLRRGGRIGRASALVGSVLQVKPVLTIADGQVAALERVRTHEKALSRVIELANGLPGRVCAFVGHAAAGTAANRIAEALEPRADTLIVGPLGPVVGAHAGPGTVGVGCYPADLFPLGIKAAGTLAAP